MRLKDYLFEDPGAPSSSWVTAYANGDARVGEPTMASFLSLSPLAVLHGQPRFDMQGYSQYTAMQNVHMLGEGKKREHGPYDHRTIGRLENGNGKIPGRAEDGKGFCFLCANGTLHAFRWRNDAMRWAKDEPREIKRFWYGEPLAPNGKFRVRVRERYVKDEDVDESTPRLTPRGLDRLLSVDVASLNGRSAIHKHRQALRVYKLAFAQGTLPPTFYRGVASHAASGRVLKDPWWVSNLEHAFEVADRALIAAQRNESAEGFGAFLSRRGHGGTSALASFRR